MSGFASAARVAVFLAVMVASQLLAVRLLTGVWGGTPHDPLWVGPLAAGLAILNTMGTLTAALILADSWRREPRPPEGLVTLREEGGRSDGSGRVTRPCDQARRIKDCAGRRNTGLTATARNIPPSGGGVRQLPNKGDRG